MPEKRAAMKKWNAFVQAMLNKKRPKPERKKDAPSIHTAAEDAASGPSDRGPQTFPGLRLRKAAMAVN
jgi:hypothetical protein